MQNMTRGTITLHCRTFVGSNERGGASQGPINEKAFFEQEWNFIAGRSGLTRFLSLPPIWPLARLMIPTKYMVKQMETLLQCYCFETIATCQVPQQQISYVHRMVIDLGQLIAMRRAETVMELLQCSLLSF